MVEPSNELPETAGVCLEEALINASNDGLAYLVLSNTNDTPFVLARCRKIKPDRSGLVIVTLKREHSRLEIKCKFGIFFFLFMY